MLEFEAVTHSKTAPKEVYGNLACCYFYLGMYKVKIYISSEACGAVGHMPLL